MRAGFWLRSVAAGLDGLAGVAAGLFLSQLVGDYFSQRAVVMLRIGDPDSFFRGPIPMVLGIFGELVFTLPLAFLLIQLVEPVLQGSPGKLLLRLSVRTSRGEAATPGPTWTRFATKNVGLWGMTLALITGTWAIGATALVLGAAVAIGFLFAAGPRKLAAHDRLARTAVYDQSRSSS